MITFLFLGKIHRKNSRQTGAVYDRIKNRKTKEEGKKYDGNPVKEGRVYCP